MRPLFLTLPLLVAGAAVKKRDVSGTAQVYFNDTRGVSKNYASGFIYGIPDTPDQIPDHFYDDMKFQYGRAGGAQLPGSQGWIGGYDSYKLRFNSALSNYRTAIQHGGRFILLIHDIWGADGSQPADAPYPGDNGNWTFYDEYLTTLISDMKANDFITGVSIDIWNEPNGSNFWNRDEDQYLQMWGHAYYRLKRDLPEVLTCGPSISNPPFENTDFYDNWAQFVTQNQSLPDLYSWHSLSNNGDTTTSLATFDALLAKYGASRNGAEVTINEYGNPVEQTSAGGAWWIAQLERTDIWGLRANWASAYELHDYMAQLLGKPGAGTGSYSPTAGGYYPLGEYNVYQYYAQNMTGTRIHTEPTDDVNGDVYAVVDGNTVRLLVGTRPPNTGTWYVNLNSLSSLGLPTSGSIAIRTIKFPDSSTKYESVGGPQDLGYYSHGYSGDSLSFPIFAEDQYTTWAFEFTI